jgi:DNA-binding helix-hairpin-helix protein with protein kinase domain
MSRQALPTLLRDHLGNEVRLAPKPFAVGGEGAVFDVQGRPDLVAKLYSKPQSKDRCDKLRAMAKLCSPDLVKIAAWPAATLNAGNPAVVNGILMPKVTGYLEIHHLYSVAQRKKDFPEADWGFLLHTARNCAIAFEAVHRHGHVVGDVNQKNVMVSGKGVVAFVDCDSFQVAEGSRIFRCGVGVPEYTPPELHGKNFESLDRSANHDLFGLGVLVFHLLMMGRHPFSGVPLVKVDIPIEKAIQAGFYAYTRDTARAKLKPPPHVPPVTMLDASVLDLFERAFCTQRRPTATEWRASLDAAMKQLVRCKNDPRHSYLSAAGKCPWCELIAVARLMFFLPGQGAAGASFRPEDIQQLIPKLAGLDLRLDPYTRPRGTAPVRVSLPAGLRAPGPRPTLHPLPLPPVDPPLPQAPTPDPFFARLCVGGVVAGAGVFAIAWPVGLVTMALFAIWWVLLLITGKRRMEIAQAQLESEHQFECARRDEEYAGLCELIEAANRRLVAAWEVANAPWVAEEKKWSERSTRVEAELKKREAELLAQRTACVAEFGKRKKEADGLVATHDKARQDYVREIQQAEGDSKKIQLEAHLDRFLIRQAKLKAITNERILALESFGIETARDITMLRNQKVPGIGPVLTKRLFDWREGLATSFVPKQTLPESERSRIASRYAPVLQPLGQSLQAAIRDLEGIIGSHRTRERELLKAIGAIVENAAVADEHLKALNNLP